MSQDENSDVFHQPTSITSTREVQKAANNDLESFQKTRTGDSLAFASLFRKYYEPLYFFATRLIRDAQIAEDIVQDLFVKLWTNRHNLNIDSNFKSYLYSAVKNSALNTKKRESKISYNDTETNFLKISNYTPEQELIEKEISGAVQKAIDELPEKCRLVYLMKRHENLKYDEIAEILNISVNTVKTHIKKALKILLKKLDGLVICF